MTGDRALSEGPVAAGWWSHHLGDVQVCVRELELVDVDDLTSCFARGPTPQIIGA